MIDSNFRFSDEETRQIIARATSRQEEAERVQLDARGLTLGALQEVARLPRREERLHAVLDRAELIARSE